MDSNGSRARSFDKPEGGLSEWASKVKDMHRQVNPNEEADQKRLEDEIAASRLARQRRSHGIGGSKTNSLDLSKHKEFSSALRTEDTTSSDDPKPLADRQKSQTEALNKLMGSASPPIAKAQPTTSNRPEPMSLAAFIGGKATGPRLNKHAPQQDASDPTQFVQRTRIDAPHPVFGRGGLGGIGGIAMPGMASKTSAPREPDPTPTWSRPGRTPEPRDRRRSTPSPEKLESPPASPQRAGVRERTLSTPTGIMAPKTGPIFAPQPTPKPPSTTESRSYSTTSSSNGSPAPVASGVSTGKQTSTSPSSPPGSKSPVVTPSLVRSIQPDPRASPQGRQISMSQAPSLAFLRSPPAKDPTPSLSRLQGRGFVQNMVKVSSQLESPTPSPGSEKSRPTSGRKSSVLDRWPSPAPAPSPPPSPMRRSRTVEPPASVAPTSVKAAGLISKSYSDIGKGKVDEPSSPVKPTPGLAHAPTAALPSKDVSGVDELGFKRTQDPTPRPSKTSTIPESSKPLVHPTKDRARKPKKNRTPAPEQESSHLPPPSSAAPAESIPPAAIASPSSREDLIHSRPLPAMGQAQSAVPPKTAIALPVPGSNGGSSGMVGRRALPANPAPTLPVGGSNTSVGGSGMVGRRALPGMTQPNATPPSISPKPANLVSPAEPVLAPRALPGLASAVPPNLSQQDNVPPFGPHSRPPSSGRPTVMDMAQALADPPPKHSPAPPAPPPAEEPTDLPAARPRNMMPSATSQNRRSSYDRYSMVLPPLKEEATPDPTPVSTLTRAVGNSFAQPDFDLVALKLRDAHEEVEMAEEISKTAEPEIVRFTHVDDPLPRIDVSPLLKYKPPSLPKDLQTIQVDVIAIAGNSAFPLGLSNTFYDTEILAIIHRSKSNSTGLISSTVWSWQGKNSSMEDSEERKLAELAKRYGTSIVPIHQLSEPVELVRCLGGTLAIRQGSRAHWANDNTAVHIIRSLNGVIFIDQIEIGIKNLCSGFSYCVSILNTVYVWYGRGSTSSEREAAMDYAKTLTSNPDVLIENESDDDEMFWMVLGDAAEYAKADYWRWRPSVTFTPRIWCADASQKNTISPVQSFRQEQAPHTSVYILDCVFEFFVLVPSGARGKRRDIRLALSAAMDAADRLASARPFTPTIHTLILPSQIPIDLRLQFRDLEEVFLNDADIPEHMNILSSREAQTHLQTSSWLKSQLKDRTMLPLGLDESHVASI
ncbi:Gelsolin repeat [Mycena sanguinolenta]|uniref:Gelsolin repeat n=1 Tax=Mycena sanguinolenta TaxID=230812 RepID=A0A8H6ZH84_9AGAR|nr:Gelsolin repeat [Mycena sanguinolenta]